MNTMASWPALILVNVSLRYEGGQTEVAGLELPVLPVAPVVLGPPLRRGPWLAINALSNGSLHRRTVLPFATVHVSERYAIDYLLASDAGRIASTPGTRRGHAHVMAMVIGRATRGTRINPRSLCRLQGASPSHAVDYGDG